MVMAPTLLGHVGASTGQKHYNQARMLDAGGRFSSTMSGLREDFLSAENGDRGGSQP
jgi:hypothetical protein